MRLLLVEDDRMLWAGVQQGLRRLGHAVDRVRDGKAVSGVDDLRAAVERAKGHDGVALLVQRGDVRMFVPVELG